MTELQETPDQKPFADKAFRYFMQVRYGECDAQKVVFNARYGDYIDLAVTEFLHHLGADNPSVDTAFDYQVVKLTIEWRGCAPRDPRKGFHSRSHKARHETRRARSVY